MSPFRREELKKMIIDTLLPLGVERISLFGSFARRESSPNDIDILVRFKKHGKRNPIGLAWFTLDQELSKKIGIPVDLVTEDSLSSTLRSIIEKDLEVIYEKAG
jgi:predicted nucleotidyltransferase